jgi:hypothetical protein
MKNSYKIKNIIDETNNQRPITLRAMERYKKKVNATCKILSGNEGSGFFCEIKVNNRLMKVLFTNNHVINNLNSDIKIEHNKEKKIIKLSKNRFKCTNEELDYTCIEILKEDGFNNYFKIDKNININNPYEEYKYDDYVMIQYPGGDDVSFAQGYINNIKDENIIYTMKTEYGSSGSPLILDTRNLKIIGIHCQKTSKNNDEKKAIFMKYIIQDIEKQLQNYNNNKDNNNKFNINKDNQKIYNNHPPTNNNQNNNKSSIQNNNNNNKNIIQNNQIIKLNPIGKKEWDNKTLDLYSEEQWKDSKGCW